MIGLLLAAAVAAPPSFPGHIVLRGPNAGQAQTVQAAFDGTRVALLKMRGSHVTGAEVRQLAGGPAATVRFVPEGICADSCDGPFQLVLAGTQVAFDDGWAGNTEAATELYAGPAPGRTHGVSKWHWQGLNTQNIRRWLSFAGQGTVLAFVSQRGRLELFDRTSSHTIADGISKVWAVDKRRILAQRMDGTAVLLDPAGRPLRELPNVQLDTSAGNEPVVALQGDDLVTATSDGLQVFDVSSGALEASYPLDRPVRRPLGARRRGRLYTAQTGNARLYLVRLADGATTDLPLPPASGRTIALDARGLDYSYSTRPAFLVRELPWSRIDALLS